MYCEHCGSTISNDAEFCKSCSEAHDHSRQQHKVEADGQKAAGAGGRAGPNITVDRAGALSWAYELSFWSNPTILITVFKVMLLALAFPVVLAFVLGLEDGVSEAGALALTMLGIGAAIMAGLLIVAYVLVGLAYGGKYQVLFKMDERGIHHIQLKKQYDRAAAMGLLTALVGLAGGNLSAAGAGLMSASRQSLYTEFSAVRSVKVKRRRNVIYVNEALSRNQVYAADEDLPLVREFILAHCPPGVRVS